MMKIHTLIVLLILMISCNSSTSDQKVLPHLPQVKTNSHFNDSIVEKNTEIKAYKDSLQIDTKEALTIPPPPVNKESVEKTTPVIPKKEIITKEDTEVKIPKEKIVAIEPTLTVKVNKYASTKPNHEIWNKLTKAYVSPNGKVNYTSFKSALHNINDYLLHLQNTPPTNEWSKNEKLAYWFNLYNASTVLLVTSNYPVKSIKDINGGKPWDKKFIKSGTHLYSLNDIENTLVRPNYNEPRLHVAFNCAAVSCPNLLNAAFIPTKLNAQLNSLSKQWINDSSKNKITADQIEVSQIFNWYSVDFKEGIIPFVNNYSQTIKANPAANITFMPYNWKLND